MRWGWESKSKTKHHLQYTIKSKEIFTVQVCYSYSSIFSGNTKFCGFQLSSNVHRIYTCTYIYTHVHTHAQARMCAHARTHTHTKQSHLAVIITVSCRQYGQLLQCYGHSYPVDTGPPVPHGGCTMSHKWRCEHTWTLPSYCQVPIIRLGRLKQYESSSLLKETTTVTGHN